MALKIRLLTKAQLKAERLKPAPGQEPTTRYWQGQGWVYQYNAHQAIAMRPYRPPSTAQSATLSAGRRLTATEPCAQCGDRIAKHELDRNGSCFNCNARMATEEAEREWQAACAWADSILEDDPLFLDTETTGLDQRAEVIEIAVLDRYGNVLLETLVKPGDLVPADATAIHGLSNGELLGAPAWPAVAEQLAGIVNGRVLVAHNAAFDRRLIDQSSARHALAPPVGERWECTLELLTGVNGGRWPNLGVAMALAGAQRPAGSGGRPHRAAFDAECCRQVLLALGAKNAKPMGVQPADARADNPAPRAGQTNMGRA